MQLPGCPVSVFSGAVAESAAEEEMDSNPSTKDQAGYSRSVILTSTYL